MRCEHIKEKFPDFLVGELDQKSMEEIQSHMAECPSCREEMENLSALWTKLGVLPEERPSNGLRQRFYSMLEEYKEEVSQERPVQHLRRFFSSLFGRSWGRRPVLQFGFSFLLLFIGLTIGYFVRAGNQNAELHQELQGMRQMLAVSLLEQRSSIQRLKGINLSYDLKEPNSQTIDALLDTLDSDPSINVRLAAVDALYLFYDYPSVRENVIHSLSKQTSPLVQVALVDLLVTMQERQALESFRKLIQANELDPGVKQKLERGIQELSF
jgi:hypothetical protein